MSTDNPALVAAIQRARAHLRTMLDAAIDSARPDRCIPLHLPDPPEGKTVIVGAGKAAAAMARALENNWPGPLEGAVVTRYGHGVHCDRIKILEAAHPIGDQAGIRAAKHMLGAVANLAADDLVICLLSGGGSALLPAPPKGLSLKDEQTLTRLLLRSGASISEINCVRTHLSLIKGGRLAAAAYPAKVVSLIISDVPGDDPSLVASGPTLAPSSSRKDAIEIVERYAIPVSPAVQQALATDAHDGPTAAELAHSEAVVIANAMGGLKAAASIAEQAGYRPVILGDAIEGEARDVGGAHADRVREILFRNQPAAPPCALLSGGETSVTVRNSGRGGRNAEFLLGLLTNIGPLGGVAAIAADTDGIDGTEDNAGAIIDETSLDRARRRKLDPVDTLRRNDAYSFFRELDDLVMTGPTLTNINDFRAILIDPADTRQGSTA